MGRSIGRVAFRMQGMGKLRAWKATSEMLASRTGRGPPGLLLENPRSNHNHQD